MLLGGTGFVGEYVIKQLIKNRNCRIAVAHNSPGTLIKIKNLVYVKMDLAKQPVRLKKLTNSTDIIVVMTQPNIKIIENLLGSIKANSQLKKIVYLSTLLLYGDSVTRQDETSPLEPQGDYEIGKYLEEQRLRNFCLKNKTKLCIIRLANVYGDIKNRGIIGKIFQSIKNHQVLTVNNQGQAIRDYIFVEDAARLIKFLIFFKQKAGKETFNVCASRGYSVLALIKKIQRITGQKVGFKNGGRVREKKKIIGDNKKILKLLGGKLIYNLDRGLKKTCHNLLKY